MVNVDTTIELIKQLHAGQFDKGGVEYWKHPKRVYDILVKMFPDVSEDEKCAALLHDVLEDTPTTEHDLLMFGYSNDVVYLVKNLSRDRNDGKTYIEWIKHIINIGDKRIIQIKLSDNIDNNDPVRITQLPEDQRGITNRYKRAYDLMIVALGSFK